MSEEPPGNTSETSETSGRPDQKYLWPKLLLAALLMGGVISVLFVGKEVKRMRTIKDAMHAATNTSASTNK